MSKKIPPTLSPIETCRIKTGCGRTGLSETELTRLRDDIEEQYGTRNFHKAQRRIFALESWRADR